MKTHTVRNKANPVPIFTFTPEFMEELQRCYPETIALVIDCLTMQYKHLTGKTPRLDYEQRMILDKLVGMNEQGIWTSKLSKLDAVHFRIMNVYAHALCRSTAPIDEVCIDAQAFYTMLYQKLPNAQ